MNTIPVEDREPGLVAQCASEIDPERVVFVWEGRLALGKHTCIAGEPGTSKSILTTLIAATVSVAGYWPCGEGIAPKGSVIILSAEDDAADTIVPRLLAANADMGRVHIVSAVRTGEGATRGFNLQADITLLEEKITEIGDVILVIIDPISSYLGKADSHKNAEVRGVLEPLSAMAARMRVAVLSVTHFSKTGAVNNAKALHRFIGSIAFVGAPRMAFAVIEDAENPDRRLLLHTKNNLARPPQGLAFSVRQIAVCDGIMAPRAQFEDVPVTMTADTALASTPNDGQSTREDAKDFLRQMLAEGPIDVAVVNKQAAALGISERTLKRARAELGAKPLKSGFEGGWQLHPAPERGQGGQPNDEEGHQNAWPPSGDLAPFDVFPKGATEMAEMPKRATIIDVAPLEHLAPLGADVAEFPEIPPCLDRRSRRAT